MLISSSSSCTLGKEKRKKIQMLSSIVDDIHKISMNEQRLFVDGNLFLMWERKEFYEWVELIAW